MGAVAALWRHPLKSHGRETLASVRLTAGQGLPWDRHWAVTHRQTKPDRDDTGWQTSRNFMIGTVTPGLLGLWSTLDEATATLTLRHAELGELTFRPDNAADFDRFLTWVAPLCPEDRLTPTGIATAARAMTDTPFPSVSIANTASHAAVEDVTGGPLDPARWRANIWIDGFDAWAENDWLGRTVRIGEARLTLRERTKRCTSPGTHPVTGIRDIDLQKVLRDHWDHTDFGVYAEVVTGGEVAVGAPVELEA